MSSLELYSLALEKSERLESVSEKLPQNACLGAPLDVVGSQTYERQLSLIGGSSSRHTLDNAAFHCLPFLIARPHIAADCESPQREVGLIGVPGGCL